MKATIFVIAACAVALSTATPTWNQQASFLDVENNNNNGVGQSRRNQQTSPYSFSSTNNNDDDDNQNSWQPPTGNFYQQSHQQQQQHQQRHNSWRNQQQRIPNIFADNAVSNNWIDVQPFHAKITRRLEESSQLEDQHEIKQKIVRLANAKMNHCKDQTGGNSGKVDAHCGGYATGQIMQLIASVEKGGRDLPHNFEF